MEYIEPDRRRGANGREAFILTPDENETLIIISRDDVDDLLPYILGAASPPASAVYIPQIEKSLP